MQILCKKYKDNKLFYLYDITEEVNCWGYVYDTSEDFKDLKGMKKV